MSKLVARYEGLIASGELRPDPEQRHAAEVLGRVETELEGQRSSSGLIDRLLRRRPERVRGAYLWGGVGRGKSMLMDLFHTGLAIEAKRRVHFHAFMLEVHARLHAVRAKEAGDPVPPVAAALARDVRCLAFDEMVVTSSADAMIMSRLFRALICEHDVTIIATGNRPPADLYKDGLNREHFVPFIELVKHELEVVELNGPVDYRLERIGGLATWHTPLGDGATARVRRAFFRLTDFSPEDAAHVPSAEIDVSGGRKLHVPKSLKGVAVFSFKRLCATARGAADYLAIARAYHTVFIVGIPQMDRSMRNEAARFVTLIDGLYEYRVKLFATAEAEPEALYPAGDGAFEFQRTVSRLMEMQSDDYMALGHGPAG